MDREPQALFNAGIASSYRLHFLLDECNYYSRMCRVMVNEMGGMINEPNIVALDMWRSNIQSFFREISPKLKKNDVEIIKRLYLRYKKNPIFKTIRTEDGTRKIIDMKEFYNKIRLLSAVEITLRRMADKRDLLIPDKKYEVDENPDGWV